MDTDDTSFPKNPPPPPPPGALGIGGAADGFDQTVRVNVPARGTMVFSRYQLERILGRGGMGVVWLAHDTKLDRQVALKFLPNLIGLDPGAIKELKTETRRGLELSHPNIVRIYDFVDDEDAAAISMEYVDGRTLAELRMETPHGVFTVEEISKWLPGVCDALDYAHQHSKLVHRDMKPANIMVTNGDLVAKVADFGIARSLSDTMSRLSAAHVGTSGTLPYMSPQQAMGDKPGPTDDVYSLGATIYELLAGKPPFYQGDIATQINNKIPPPMLGRREELEIKCPAPIPKAWEEAIQASLAKEAYERPQSAGELAVMLGLKSAGEVTLSPKTARALAAAKAAEEKSKLPLWIGVGVAAAAVIGGAMFLNRPGEDAAEPKIASQNEAEAKAPVSEPPEETPPKTEVANAGTEDSGQKKSMAAKGESSSDEPKAGSPDVSSDGTPEKKAPVLAETAPNAMAANSGAPAPSTTPPQPAAAALPPPSVGAGETTPTPVASLSPAAVSGQMALAPESTATASPTTIVIPAQAGVEGSQPSTIVLPPGTVLPPGAVIVQTAPGAATVPTAGGAAVPTPDMPKQPVVGEPADGHWKIEQLFPTPPFAMYSENGKRNLLFNAQSKLKEKGLYSSTVDGKEGKNTHNAILLFQAKNSLIPNGLLDYPTLAALEMQEEADNKDWQPPARRYDGSNFRRGSPAPEEPNFLQRTGNKLKGLFEK